MRQQTNEKENNETRAHTSELLRMLYHFTFANFFPATNETLSTPGDQLEWTKKWIDWKLNWHRTRTQFAFTMRIRCDALWNVFLLFFWLAKLNTRVKQQRVFNSFCSTPQHSIEMARMNDRTQGQIEKKNDERTMFEWEQLGVQNVTDAKVIEMWIRYNSRTTRGKTTKWYEPKMPFHLHNGISIDDVGQSMNCQWTNAIALSVSIIKHLPRLTITMHSIAPLGEHKTIKKNSKELKIVANRWTRNEITRRVAATTKDK